MGGAVDSLVWNHREFVNSWDHGRQLQMAVRSASNVLAHRVGEIPDYHTAQIVAPSTHLTAGFTKAQSVDPDTGHVVAHDNHKPTIVSTTDDHRPIQEHVVNYHTYLCVGTVQDVAECLRILMKPYHPTLIG
nr:hypothetical protein BaRGS_022444 [Batillaria attramentaria]